MTEVEFLGMIVACGCIHMDPAKLSAIETWPLLKTVKAIQSFLGFVIFIDSSSRVSLTQSPLSLL